MIPLKYHLDKLGDGGFVGGKAAHKTPVFPHLLRRYPLNR
jgi:hypothetical protein